MKPIVFLLSMLMILQGCDCADKPKNSMKNSEEKNAFSSNGYSEVNGIKMYYEIYGEGKPLVLIHGGGSTIETSFGRIIPELSKHHQLIAVEMQAHGRTSDRDVNLSFEQDADDVAALLKNLKINKADILGFSNGGNTALQVAVRHPGMVNKVIAASALLKKNGTAPEFWEMMKNAKFEQMPQAYTDGFLKVNPDSTLLMNMFNRDVQRMSNFKEMSDEEIKSIKAPVLLLNGDRDVATSEHMAEMSKLIPDCRLAILPGGHGEYMGEVTTLKTGKQPSLIILPLVEEFLE